VRGTSERKAASVHPQQKKMTENYIKQEILSVCMYVLIMDAYSENNRNETSGKGARMIA